MITRVVCQTRRRYCAPPAPDRALKRAASASIRLQRQHRHQSRSARRPVPVVGIEQPVQVDDEIAHLGVVDGLLRLRLPGRIGGGIVRIDADDVELVEILEFGAVELASARRRRRDGAVACWVGSAIASSSAMQRARRRDVTPSANSVCVADEIEQRRVPRAARRDQRAMDRIGPIVDRAAGRRRRSSRRRLRAPKGRQPQGPSRGCCRRRRRRRARHARRAQAAAPANAPAACGTMPGADRREPLEHRASARRCVAPSRLAPALAAIGSAVQRRAAARGRQEQLVGRPARRARRAPAGRPRPAPPRSTSPARPAMKARVPSIGSTTQTRARVAAAPDRPRFPPTASRRPARAEQPLAQQIVDRDVGLADRRIALPLVQCLSGRANESRAQARRPRAPPLRAGRDRARAQTAGNGQPLQAQRRRVGAVAEFEIVGRRQRCGRCR